MNEWTAERFLHHVSEIAERMRVAANEHCRPSALFKPAVSRDGDQWCALYGENLMEGVAGFGDTPNQACVNFDIAWLNERATSTVPASEVEK